MRRNIDADPSQTWLAIRFQNKPRAGTNFCVLSLNFHKIPTFTKFIQFKPAFTWTNPSLIVAMQFTIHAKHPRSSSTISFKKDGWPSLTWASRSFDAYDNFTACDLSMFTTRYYKYSILFLFFSCSCLRLSNWFGHFKAMLLGKFQTFLIQRHKLSTSDSETKNGGNKSVLYSSSLMFIIVHHGWSHCKLGHVFPRRLVESLESTPRFFREPGQHRIWASRNWERSSDVKGVRPLELRRG